jgi:hypothetical protein
MTIITGSSRAGVSLRMASDTLQQYMGASQWEGSCAVIESGGYPCRDVVTRRAVMIKTIGDVVRICGRCEIT